MGTEDIYLAPENTNDSVALSDSSESEAFEKASTIQVPKKCKSIKRIEEIPEQRGTNFKVFRMDDGSEQAIFSPHTMHVFDDETHTFEEIENTITEDADGKHFTSGKNRFVAKFSREENNDNIFSIEQGMHKVSVYAKKNAKNKNKGIIPILNKSTNRNLCASDIITFTDIEPDTDYEYSIKGDGVKENIIIKKHSNIYRYPFVIKGENVTIEFNESTKRVSFISNESGNEVFFIPSPFMVDANGATSSAVDFEVKIKDNGLALLTVIADSEWINSTDRAFPVAIDPQINLPENFEITTYSWHKNSFSTPDVHIVGATDDGDDHCNFRRMYISFNMPELPRNPRIKKVELELYQPPKTSSPEYHPLYTNFGLYPSW